MSRVMTLVPRISCQCVRSFRTSSILKEELKSVDLSKVKANQKRFQIDNSVPVHLKGGMMDRMLFAATCGLCVVGLGMVGATIFEYSFPQK